MIFDRACQASADRRGQRPQGGVIACISEDYDMTAGAGRIFGGLIGQFVPPASLPDRIVALRQAGVFRMKKILLPRPNRDRLSLKSRR